MDVITLQNEETVIEEYLLEDGILSPMSVRSISSRNNDEIPDTPFPKKKRNRTNWKCKQLLASKMLHLH